MKLQLRPYQQEAVDAVYRYLREHDDNPCVVLPTAAGKSVVIGKIASDAVSLWDGRVLILAHVKELLEQNASKVVSLVDGIPVGIYSAGLNSRDTDTPIVVAGIQSVYNKADVLGSFDLIIVDEAHLIAPEGDGMYRTFLQDMKLINPYVRVIGFTATPYRLKGGLICQPENILNAVCYEIGVKEMIAQGYLSPLISRAGRVEAKLTDLHVRGGEFLNAEITAAMDKTEITNAACNEIVQLTKERKFVLIFATSVEHCEHIAERLRSLGQEVEIVTGDTPAAERAELLDRFKGKQVPADLLGNMKPPLKFLVNVNVLTTGFDAPNVDCVVLLRPTASPALYVQMCLDSQTEILTENGWKNINEIQDYMNVAAFDMATEKIEFCPIENIVKRELSQSEYMVEVKAPHLDIRVTNLHDWVYKTRHSVIWKKRTSEDLMKLKSEFNIPVCGNTKRNGIKLTDDEIRFIGWMLTDGCFNPKNMLASISQSVASAFNKNIEAMLKGCGMGYRKYRYKHKGDLAKYADSYRYEIPFGQPRGENQHLRGWGYLFDFLQGDICKNFFDANEHQIEVLLEAMNQANGRKLKNVDWTPKGYTLCMGNHKYLADRLQALLVQRGYRCNMSTFKQKTNFHKGEPKEQYVLYLKKQCCATIGGTTQYKACLVKNRCSIQKSKHEEKETVWCVKNRLGTLVTRRNGKVAILGNCGRGFRLSPQTGKTDCLVLDYGENVLRHGPVDCVTVKDKTSGKGKAPAKKCPECLALIHAGYGKCPECGYEFPPPETTNLQHKASNAGILSGQAVVTEYSVGSVSYSVHRKRGADESVPCTMRVDYEVGFHQFKSEWVCPEHTGYARGKFERWWKERAVDGCPMPDTAAEAVALANKGYLAEPMAIKVKQITGDKYERICSWMLKEKPIPEPGALDEFAEEYHSNSPGDLGVAQDDSWMDDAIPF